ncbi:MULTISPECIES: FixH family protein [Pseudoalteromonas]|uniref:CcoH-like protein n=1 Tax=Pseudoalteromonas amylolytica TaxID=1859457 RepID=A0A1S1MLD7_9GAMM|nr:MULTISPECIES: FixH family protein [Pseudoalteromonas]MCF6436181.1 FixH family protein [Pseudoalteromonas sp. MMG022]OHU86948.1 CcoH-like protein [Pseudoalteromonas sp. JW3]OHU88343.1 CcoH-like protein [Pseudoalteromonas amylolytica]
MNPTPWYKNFWPWFLMFFPLATIVACVVLVVVAVGNGPDMVVDDYYKKGKAINLELTKFNKAKALYLHGELQVDNDYIKFVFTKGDHSKVQALKASFYHRTIKAHDFNINLLPNANGEFTAILEQIQQGAYTVFLEPMDGSWKLKENIQLPTQEILKISPEYK